MRFLGGLLLAAMILGCSGAPQGLAAGQEVHENGKSGRAYIYSVCEHESEGVNGGAILATINRRWSQGLGSVCVGNNNYINISDKIIRVYPINEYSNYLSLHCDGGESDKFIDGISVSGKLALVLDGRVFGVFSYLDKEKLRKNCGLFSMSDLGDALDLCEEFVSVVGGEAKKCSSYCDAGKVKNLPGICVVGNAGNPFVL